MTAEEHRRYKRDYLTLAVLGLFFIGALGMLIVVGHLKSVIDKNGDGTLCVLRELNDHRQNNFQADQKQLEAAGVTEYDQPAPPQLPSGIDWDSVCDGILIYDHEHDDEGGS